MFESIRSYEKAICTSDFLNCWDVFFPFDIFLFNKMYTLTCIFRRAVSKLFYFSSLNYHMMIPLLSEASIHMFGWFPCKYEKTHCLKSINWPSRINSQHVPDNTNYFCFTVKDSTLEFNWIALFCYELKTLNNSPNWMNRKFF